MSSSPPSDGIDTQTSAVNMAVGYIDVALTAATELVDKHSLEKSVTWPLAQTIISTILDVVDSQDRDAEPEDSALEAWTSPQ